MLVVEEIGYLPITRDGAMLYFQLMVRRCEHASTILTSNKNFEEWADVFGDDVMAAALIDRLLHHCLIVNIRGNSNRMRSHSDLWQNPSPPPRQGPGLTCQTFPPIHVAPDELRPPRYLNSTPFSDAASQGSDR